MNCCDRQTLNRMRPDNVMCVSCGHHWWKGREFTRKAWDDFLSEALWTSRYRCYRRRWHLAQGSGECTGRMKTRDQWIEARGSA